MKVRQTLLSLAAFAGLVFGPSAASAQQAFAVLNGGFEVPSHDPTFVGTATIMFVTPKQICFAVLVNKIDTPNAMHIHSGLPGVSGPIVIPLTAPPTGAPGKSTGCIGGLDPAVVKDIHNNPSSYYINVHTGAFPGGAVRGQLF